MANFYGKDRETDFAAAKLMSFGKSFSRMNGQPLDESEVWYNKAELEAFAAGNSAYVGMKLVYVDETNQKVYQYSVQYDGSIKEIGVAPLGDSKSIVVDAETGTVSLKGIDTLVFERDILDENDEPTGNKESVQYQPLMTKDGLVWVEPSKTTVEGLATLIEGLDQRTTALETKVGKAAEGETEATGLYKAIDDLEKSLDERLDILEDKEDKDTTYSVKEGEKILSLTGTEFSTTLKIVHEDNEIKLLGVNDEEISSFDASVFVADGVLEDVSYDATTSNLTFTWNIVTGEDEEGQPIYKTNVVNIADLIDTYTAGEGLGVENNEFKVVIDPTSENFLTVSANGVKLSGVNNAIAAAIGEYANDENNGVASGVRAEIAAVDAKFADVNEEFRILNEYIDDNGTYSLESVRTDVKANKEAIALLNNNENTVGSVDYKIKEAIGIPGVPQQGTHGEAGWVDEVPGTGIHVNIYSKAETDAKIAAAVKSATGGESASAVKADLEAYITSNNTRVKNIEDILPTLATASALQSLDIEVKENTRVIGEVSGELSRTNTTVQEHGTKIGTLETTVAGHDSTIASHTESITTLTGAVATKAEQTALDAAVADIAKNTTAITTLNETTLPGLKVELEGEIAKKADKTALNDYYTKAEIGDITGNLGGKSIIALITATETKITELTNGAVKDNTEALAVLIGEDTNKSVRNIAADEINTIIGGVSSADTIEDIKSLIEYVNTNGASVQGINKEIDDLQALVGASALTDGGSTLINRITALETAGHITANDLGNDGAVSVSTDRLFNGNEELIFCAGDAGKKPEAVE